MSKIKQLEKDILRYKAEYYQGRPTISDHDYDQLEEELRTLSPENPVLNIVGTVTSGQSKVAHEKKMLSLDKTYVVDDLKKWMKGHEVVSTYKIDGVSCSLLYSEGKLSLAKTRGDGSFGENITSKVLWMDTVPKEIASSSEHLEIRGEIYCDEKSFFELSEEMVSISQDRPTSQRNIVAGLISRKENLELNRYIKFKAFEFLDPEGNEKTEMERHQKLSELGFDAIDMILHKDDSLIDDVLDETVKYMSEGDVQIDGLVLSYNDLRLHAELGETAHHPRYKMAFKFKGESKPTEINEIVWGVSRNGILTPVANIEPIELSGAMISRVTLHNYGMVRQYNLKRGDRIEIIRSGEVIPKFLSVLESSNSEFEIPTKCPSCEENVAIKDIRIICENDNCPAKVKETILNYIQKIGIDDLSSKRLDEMIRKGLVKTISDLYKLSIDDLLTLDKTKETLANKLHSAIEKSKGVDLITFLSALGISGGAYNKCEKVVRAGFDTIPKLKDLTSKRLQDVESFAEKSSFEFVSSLNSKMTLVDELLELGFNFDPLADNSGNPVSGKKICITGSLSEKRSVIEGKIRAAGGVIVGSVSKNTDFLLTNETEAKSSKYKKALDLGIDVVSEETVMNWCND